MFFVAQARHFTEQAHTTHNMTVAVSFQWLMVFHWSQSMPSFAFWDQIAVYTEPQTTFYSAFNSDADLMVTLVCTPLLLEIISQRTFFHFHECTASLERAFGILSHVSCTTSVFHMVAISFDRFAAVVFPLRHKILIGKCGLKAMLAVSWTIPIPPHFKAYRSTGSLSRQIYWTGNVCLHLLLYFLFYFLIVVFLLHHRKTRKQLGTRTVSVKLTTAGRYELLAQ